MGVVQESVAVIAKPTGRTSAAVMIAAMMITAVDVEHSLDGALLAQDAAATVRGAHGFALFRALRRPIRCQPFWVLQCGALIGFAPEFGRFARVLDRHLHGTIIEKTH